MTTLDQERTRYGFQDAFETLDASEWKPAPAVETSPPARHEVAKIAERTGFSSREPKEPRRKEPEGQINIRAKQAVLDRFRALGRSQEPKWPSGYVLERALDALERELRRE